MITYYFEGLEVGEILHFAARSRDDGVERLFLYVSTKISNLRIIILMLKIKLSVPPKWIYKPSDAQLSPPCRLVYSKVYVDMENFILF